MSIGPAILQVATAAIALAALALAGRLWWRDRVGALSRPADRAGMTPHAPERSNEQGPPLEPEHLEHAHHAKPSPRVDRPAVPDGPLLITVPDLASRDARPVVEIPESIARRYSPIWDLADSGASPEAIARATGQPVGEIGLILGLRRTMDPAGSGRPGSR